MPLVNWDLQSKACHHQWKEDKKKGWPHTQTRHALSAHVPKHAYSSACVLCILHIRSLLVGCINFYECVLACMMPWLRRIEVAHHNQLWISDLWPSMFQDSTSIWPIRGGTACRTICLWYGLDRHVMTVGITGRWNKTGLIWCTSHQLWCYCFSYYCSEKHETVWKK